MNTVNAFLVLKNVHHLIDFTTQLFHAQVVEKVLRADGSVAYLALKIKNDVIVASEAQSTADRSTTSLYIYVDDCMQTIAQALLMGAILLKEATPKSNGEKYGAVKDDNGITWWICEKTA